MASSSHRFWNRQSGTYRQVSHTVWCFLFSVDPNINHAFSSYFNSGLLSMSLPSMLTAFYSSTDLQVNVNPPHAHGIYSVNEIDTSSADGTNIPSLHYDPDGVNPHDRSVNGVDIPLTLTGGTMPPFLMALEFPNIGRSSSY